MKENIIIIIFLTIINIIQLKAYATDSTQSATPSASVKSKLEALKLEIASKAAKLKTEINKKISNKAYIGTVASKSSTLITLTTKSATVSAEITQDTVYSTSGKAKFSLASLKTGNFIAALGEVDEKQVLHAKRVSLLPTTSYQLPIYLWGQIISVSDDLATLRNKEGKIGTISLSEISTSVKTNDFIIVTGNLNKNAILEAKFLYIIPQRFVIKPKNATQSAKLATQSAKPKR